MFPRLALQRKITPRGVDCVSVVCLDNAIKKEPQNYCSEACSTGHVSDSGCDHSGCECCGAVSEIDRFREGP
ncbi:MAG: hypothetical protein AAF580_09560 [Pseudomonadota bacterium]